MDHDQHNDQQANRGTVVQLTPRNGSSLAIRQHPASLPEFITALTPCLQLCAPVGMTVEDRDTWFDAAYMAVGHLPADVLRKAAIRAMQTADHPSKIVPAIIRETEQAERGPIAGFTSAPNFGVAETIAPDRRPPEERAAVAQSMGALLKKLKAANGIP